VFFCILQTSQPEIRAVSRTSRFEIIQNLRDRLEQLDQSSRPDNGPVLYTGSALDRLLPGKGWRAGTLTEWLSDGEGSGASTLAFAVSAELLKPGGSLVVIDANREFYPPGIAPAGIPLERTVVVQPRSKEDVVWVMEQTLRSGAASVVIGWIGLAGERILRRLHSAAETGGTFGFLVRPAVCRREPSRAEVRLWVETLPGSRQSANWRLRTSVLYRRGGSQGDSVEVELNHETSFMRLASALVRATPSTRAAGA
jgi:hypothetical protein